MLTEFGTYCVSTPYPGNTQINVKEFDGTETFIVVENSKLDWTIHILKVLGYRFDIKSQLYR